MLKLSMNVIVVFAGWVISLAKEMSSIGSSLAKPVYFAERFRNVSTYICISTIVNCFDNLLTFICYFYTQLAALSKIS